MKHRNWLVGAAVIAVLAITSCSSNPVSDSSSSHSSTTLEPLSVSVFPNSVEVLMVSVADQAGFFTKNGLKVNQVALTGGPALITSLLSGSVDIATAVNGIVWPVMKRGEEITALTGNARGWFNLIGQPDVPTSDNVKRGDLSQLKKIKGLRVGVSALGSAQQIAAQIMLHDAGLPTDWVTWVPVGGVATAVTAFKNKQIDLLSTIPPELELIGTSNYKYVANMAYYGKFNTLLDFYGAKTSWVKANPKKASAFCTSIAEAHQYMTDTNNKSKVLPILESTLGIKDPETLSSVYDSYVGVTFSPVISKDEWNRMDIWEQNTPTQGYVPNYDQSVSSSCQAIVKKIGAN